jgi:hypothetical protein
MTMKDSIVLKIILFVAGLLMILVGLQITLSPVEFYAGSGIELGPDVSLHNEIKAPAGFLLAAGVIILAGIFLRHLTYTATLLATVLYLSYAAARLVSILLDGLPVTGLIQAAMLETVVGLACLAVLLRYRLVAGEVR